MITSILSDLGTGLASFGTSFVTALVAMFKGLFFTVGESTTQLNELGQVAIVFVIVGLVTGWVKVVAGWLKLRSKSGKRRARKRA